MKSKAKTKIQFVVDPNLIAKDQSELIVRVLQEEKIKFSVNSADLDDFTPALFFMEKRNLRKVSRFKNKMIVLPSLESGDNLAASSINFSSYEEIAHYINKFFWAEKHLQIQERLKESERFYEVIKSYLEELSFKANEVESKKVFESLLELEMLLLQEESAENWNVHFKNFLKKNSEIQNFFLFKSDWFSN